MRYRSKDIRQSLPCSSTEALGTRHGAYQYRMVPAHGGMHEKSPQSYQLATYLMRAMMCSAGCRLALNSLFCSSSSSVRVLFRTEASFGESILQMSDV